MALPRSSAFLKAIFVLLASTPHASLAAELPPAGRVAQAVGPDGALTQARSYPAPYPAPYPAYATHPVAAAPYPSSSVPVSSAPAPGPLGPPCLVPMWDEEEYVCKEYEDYERNSFMDSRRVMRIEMPDGTKCTVKPPGKYSCWMGSEVTEMMCKAGVWVDGKGKPITEIEMKTAQWFMIASAVAAAVTVYLLYKMFYDTESSWYSWRLDMAVRWGFAKPAPVVEEEDTGGDTGPQPAISINISNQSGSQPTPQAQPK